MNLFVRFIPLYLLLLLLWLLFRRQAYRSCPWFFTYVLFGVVADLARFIAHTYTHHPSYTTYWITEVGYCLLGILAMYEVCRTVLGTVARRWWVRLMFPGMLVTGFWLSLARADAIAPQFAGRIAFWVMVGEITVRIVQVLAAVVLLPLLGLGSRQYTFGIAAGFGFYAAVMLPTTIRFANIGPRFNFLWSVLSLAVYSIAVLIWIWVFRVPHKNAIPNSEPSTSRAKPSRKHYLYTLDVS